MLRPRVFILFTICAECIVGSLIFNSFESLFATSSVALEGSEGVQGVIGSNDSSSSTALAF